VNGRLKCFSYQTDTGRFRIRDPRPRHERISGLGWEKIYRTLYCHYASIDAVLPGSRKRLHRNRTGRVSPRRSITYRRCIASAISGERITVRRAIQNLLSSCRDSSWAWNLVLPPRIEAEITKLTGFVEDMNTVGRKSHCPCGKSGCRCRPRHALQNVFNWQKGQR